MRKRFRKTTAVLLVFVIQMLMISCAMINVSANTSGHSQSDAVAWAESKVGQKVGTDGWCSEFAAAYIQYLTGSYMQLNGKDYAYNYPSGWTPIQYYQGFVPQPGDLVVFDYSRWAWVQDEYGNTYQAGHVGIIVSGNASTFTSLEQNTAGKYVSYCYNRTYDNTDLHVWGVVRPDFINHNPQGLLEGLSGGGSKISISGWTFDRDDLSRPLEIHVYIGGNSGDPNAECHVGIIANQGRSDVNAVYACGDYHGFNASIYTNKRGQQPVYVYALNIGEGNDNPLIGEGTVNISDSDDPHIDMGSVFFAKLEHFGSGKFVTQEDPNGADGSNVAIYQDDNKKIDSYQLWKFERQIDLSYKISNVKTGHCLDVYGSYMANGTNVLAHTDNGQNNQRWYFVYGNGSAFSLIPRHAQGSALDLYGNYSPDGSNIQLYEKHGLSAQLFVVRRFEILVDQIEYNKNTYLLYNYSTSWDDAKAICESKGGHLVAITSTEEANTVNSLLSRNSNACAWIGLYRDNENWKWITNEQSSYHNWDEDNSQPDNYGGVENCVCIRDGKWHDYENKANYTINSFICEFENTDFNLTATVDNNKSEVTILHNSVFGAEQYMINIYDSKTNELVFSNEGLPDREIYIKLGNGDYYANITTDNNLISDDVYFSIKKPLIGDTNLDGRITVNDVTAIQRHLVELETFNEEQLALADTNSDGEINIADATHLQMFLAEYDVVLGKK